MQPRFWERLRSFGPENHTNPRKSKDWLAHSLILSLLAITLCSAVFFVYGNPGRFRNEAIDSSSLLLRHQEEPSKFMVEDKNFEVFSEKCQGKLIYVYPLPTDFNEQLVEKCGKLSGIWVPMCGKLDNSGLGPPVSRSESTSNDSLVLQPEEAWYRTEQFSLEVLFHERIKKYPCLTNDPELANAFYIPFYGALDTAFTLFSSYLQVRDRLSQRLVGWLSGNPIWSTHKSQRHFMVLGRVSWDFSRKEESENEWGNALLSQPELANVTKLLIERKTWSTDELAVPYPTSFHPSSDEDIKLWQETVRGARRDWLTTFVGSSRGPNASRALRGELVRQCERSQGKCKEVKCSGEASINCGERPEEVIRTFARSVFCLQPYGDSPTRKGIFDSLLAGCIPVLFSNFSAYKQYAWHLPGDGSRYSVYFQGEEVVDGKVDVMKELELISSDRVREMQAAVVEVIPQIVYSLPDHGEMAMKDAFDIAIDNLLSNVSIPAYA